MRQFDRHRFAGVTVIVDDQNAHVHTLAREAGTGRLLTSAGFVHHSEPIANGELRLAGGRVDVGQERRRLANVPAVMLLLGTS